MSRVLFLVHGMGRFDPAWSAEVTAKLDEVALRYPRFREQYPSGGLADNLDQVVEITYDQEFSRLVNEWNESVKALEEAVEVNEVHAGAPIDIGKVLGWLERANPTEKSFFWSHAVDVLLYKFFPLVTDQVRLSVLNQLTKVLAARNVRASVLSHSLGTRVTHDCLSLLGTVPFGGGESLLAENGYRFEEIFMVANVGKIVGGTYPADPDVYRSVVHPITVAAGANPLPGYCVGYYSFRHALDPFTLVSPFKPTGWGPDYHTPAHDLDHIADWNVHGFLHYLDHPAVHVPIVNALLSVDEEIVSDAELQIAIANYRAPSLPPCVAAITKFRATVEGLKARIVATPDVQTLVIAGAEFYAAVEEARHDCK